MNPWTKTLLILLLLGCTALSIIRLSRFHQEGDNPLDLRQIYAGSVLASQNEDPYNDSLLKTSWQQQDSLQHFSSKMLPGGPENYMLYPPHFTLWTSAFSDLSWKDFGTAGWIIAGLSAWLFVVVLHFLFREDSPGFLLCLGIIAGFKAMAPALLLAQPLFLAALFIVSSFWCLRHGKKVATGFLLACAALKPSLLIPVLFYLIYLKEYKILALFSLFLVSFQLPVLLIYGDHTSDIYFSWLQNIQRQQAVVEQAGHTFLAGNMTQLRAAWFGLTGQAMPVPELLLLLVSSAAVFILARLKRLPQKQVLLLLLLSAFLFSYHLYYDLLLLALCLDFISKRKAWEWLLFLPLFLPLSSLGDHPMLHFHMPFCLLLLFGFYLVKGQESSNY